jgi:tRNA G10  N-methylase Trm11
MDPLIEAYLGIYDEENRGEVYLNMSPEEKQKRRNIRWADNTHGITPDNTIMIRDKDTANLVNKMRVSRHKKSPSLEKERTQGTVRNKYLHRQQDKKELRNKFRKIIFCCRKYRIHS